MDRLAGPVRDVDVRLRPPNPRVASLAIRRPDLLMVVPKPRRNGAIGARLALALALPAARVHGALPALWLAFINEGRLEDACQVNAVHAGVAAMDLAILGLARRRSPGPTEQDVVQVMGRAVARLRVPRPRAPDVEGAHLTLLKRVIRPAARRDVHVAHVPPIGDGEAALTGLSRRPHGGRLTPLGLAPHPVPRPGAPLLVALNPPTP